MTNIPEAGSISSGTMRPQDLIPTFLDALETYWPEKHKELIDPKDGTPAVPSHVWEDGDDSPWWASDDALYLLNELFDHLDECAPEGMHFGAHEGDAADYGFWHVQEET